ncbi:hypothetical protein OIU78_024696 [Salix suchowensis]|nr:hypothetical protein OIU78_024696 [Salix suchowensis]
MQNYLPTVYEYSRYNISIYPIIDTTRVENTNISMHLDVDNE